MWDVITHPCPNFNDGLTKIALGGIISSYNLQNFMTEKRKT